ncbi:unnamed protein product [Scytosiphon promiscuus]
MSPRSCYTLVAVAVAGAVLRSDAFLSYPGPPSKNDVSRPDGPKSKVDGKPKTAVGEPAVGPSPNIETIPIGSPLHGLPVDSGLTAMQARAIALEAAASKTGELGSFAATTLDALNCLAHSSALELSEGSAASLPVESIAGLWSLCFCEGDFLQGLEVDNHGYISSGQDVEILFDTEDERLVLGSRGFASSLPVAVQGGLSYSPETRAVTGTFDQETVGIESLALQACLVDEDALAFHANLDEKNVFLLFRALKSKAAADRLTTAATAAALSALSEVADVDADDTEAEKAATARVAGKQLLDLKLSLSLLSGEEQHEDKRLAVQETGRSTGSFNTFMRYLETEGAMLYAVLAGPILLSFLKHYTPVAANKATAAAIVMVETVKHIVKANV